MSEWFYIYLAYGLTWLTLSGYGLHLVRRSAAASAALRSDGTERGGVR